jgi:hypothetical protein
MKKAAITLYFLVFSFFFLILLAGLLSFILIQLKAINQKIAWQQAFEIAEAGLNYYQWCLNNGVSQNCQTEKEYQDAFGNAIGKFQISSEETMSCGSLTSRKIVSTGFTYKYPNLKRKISVFYGRESVAKYSYILDSNVWIGSDHEIKGPYHSNGGIRMDGENQSTVSSALSEWVCTDSFGCSPCPTSAGCKIKNNQCYCPGVFTTTNVSNPQLFVFPYSSFDFTGVTVDLAQIKNIAKSYGIYLQPSKNINSQGKGYHLIFKDNGTVEVRIITKLSPTYAYSLEEGWHYDYFTISQEYTFATYSLSPSCPLIFVEDNLWPEGKIKGKVTLASANLIDPNLDTDVILQNNIDYTLKDGSDGLTLISERNILISPNSPDQMELRGIFIAQKGRFGRNHYPGNIKNKLEIVGSIVSKGRVGTQWVSGSQVVSGYLKRETSIDPYLLYLPPAFTPNFSQEFKLIKWEEIEK